MEYLNKLVRKDLVIGLTNLNFEKNHLCKVFQKRKHIRITFKAKKKIISTYRPFQLLHMDLFGSSKTKSFGENLHVLIV